MTKPWLWLPPQVSYRLAGACLALYGRLSPDLKSQPPVWSPLLWRNLKFSNRLGLAGGVDKDGDALRAWWKLGAGFLEIGTVTPKPQPGHSGKVVDRDNSKLAVWNRLGFPSRGVLDLSARLRALNNQYLTPVFANIGKNANTPIDSAHTDYLECIESLQGQVDGFVVNVSSPNTTGLTSILTEKWFASFLRPIVARCKPASPLLLKLPPDLSESHLQAVLKTAIDLDVDGFVLTNSSTGLRDGLAFPSEGGVSGQPLSELSKLNLQRTLEILGPHREGRLIVSVGGILTPQDVFERLAMGADLVQVYSALIFHGPTFFRHVARRAIESNHRVANAVNSIHLEMSP